MSVLGLWGQTGDALSWTQPCPASSSSSSPSTGHSWAPQPGWEHWGKTSPRKGQKWQWERGREVRREQHSLKCTRAHARAGRPLAKVNPLQKESGGKSGEQVYTKHQLCHYVTTGLCQLQGGVTAGPDIVLADKETLVESPASFLCCSLAVHMTGGRVGAKFIPPHHDHITETLPLST